MTISTTTSRVSYPGAGSAGPFAVPFRVFASSDLVVTKLSLTGAETTLALITDYTVAGAGNPTCSVTLAVALAVGELLTIRRVLPITQATSLSNQGPYFGKTHEDEFDRLTMVDQQQQEQLDRSIHLSDSLQAAGAGTALTEMTAGKVVTGTGTGFTMTALDSSSVSLPGAGRSVATLSAYLADNAVFAVEDYRAIGESDSTAFQKAINAAQVNGGVVIAQTGRNYTLVGLTVRSGKRVHIFGYGSVITIKDASAPLFSFYGVRHEIAGFGINQQTQADHCLAIAFKHDATTPNSTNSTCRDLHLYSVYNGFLVDMNNPGLGNNYRHEFYSCVVENYYQQKTWAGSYGYKFTGTGAYNGGGNDTKVFGGLVKGYEKNVILKNAQSPTFIALSNDGGAVAYSLEAVSAFRLVGGYVENNDSVYQFIGVGNFFVTQLGPDISNYTNLQIGTPVNIYGFDAQQQFSSRLNKVITDGAALEARNGIRIGQGMALQGYNDLGTLLYDLVQMALVGGINVAVVGDSSRQLLLSSVDVGSQQRLLAGANNTGPGGVGRAIYLPNI